MVAEIVRTDDVLGGHPRIDGTRIGVLHVHELAVACDHDPADVADQLDLTLEEVYSALAYFYAHPEEMRDVRAAHEAADSVLADRAVKPPKTAE